MKKTEEQLNIIKAATGECEHCAGMGHSVDLSFKINERD